MCYNISVRIFPVDLNNDLANKEEIAISYLLLSNGKLFFISIIYLFQNLINPSSQ